MNDLKKALAKNLACDVDDIEESSYNENLFEVGREEYLVFDNYDCAEEAAKEDFVNYWEECIQPEIENLEDRIGQWSANQVINNIDLDAIAEEAVSVDGVAHFLNSYDGSEDTEEIDGVTFYIYRRN